MQPDLTRRDFCDPREGYEGFLEFVKRNPVFVSKPIYGLGGARVQKVDASTITDLHEYYEGLLERRDFVEELIVQDDQWGALSPGSINTLRVLTFALDGKAQVIYACARIGAGTAIVDNFHQGGKGVRIDTEKGCLVGNGISKKLEESELSVTGIRFDGFEIPYWDKVVEMVCKGAVNTPDMYLIGWDVALAKDGPLIIEANSGSGWDVTQVTALKGQKDLFDWMLDEVAKSKKA
jgi:glutathione synthase/RimK-type ligase-like ATP-grasp enzyme